MILKKIATLCMLVSATLLLGQSKIDLKINNKITVNRDSDYVYAYTLPEPSTFSPDLHVWYHWYSGGTIKVTRGGYDGKLLNGKFTCFYHNKNLEEKGTIKKGLKTGKWVSWHTNGELESISHWKRGRQVRRSYHYDDKHNLVRVYKYRRGQAILKHPLPVKKKKTAAKDTLQKKGAKDTLQHKSKRKWWQFKKKDKAPKVKKSRSVNKARQQAQAPSPQGAAPQQVLPKESKSKKEKKVRVKKEKTTKGTTVPPKDTSSPPVVPTPTPSPQN